MKKIFALISVVSLFASSSAFALQSTAKAKVVKALAISETTALNFGGFLQTNTTLPGSVAINVSDAITCTNCTAFTPSGYTPKAGVFAVVGENSFSYTVSVPSSITLTRDGGSETMTADLSSSSAGALSAAGSDTVKVSGTLNFLANQVAGTYQGNYNITVQY